jgi:hypothetical protein
MSAQRRQVAHAARWLDHDDQELAALWWQELMGDLSRSQVVAALGIGAAHTRVRLQRMRHQLDLSRHLVSALEAEPPCPDLEALTDGWDGVPGPRWRKRFARHVRDCPRCAATRSGLIPMERLVLGGALILMPPDAAGALTGTPVTTGALAGTPATTGAGGWLAHVTVVKVAAVVAVGATVSGGVHLATTTDPPRRPFAASTALARSPGPDVPAPAPTAEPATVPTGRVVIRPAGQPGAAVTLRGEDLVTTGGSGTVFTVAPGIADPACISLRAPDGRWVRHASFRIVVAKQDDRQLFRQDATFCAQRGPDPDTYRFTSPNYPNRFVRVQDGYFQLTPGQAGAGFAEETTFTLTPDR